MRNLSSKRYNVKDETTKQKLFERSTLLVTTVTSFMAPFLFSSVNVAMPAIQKSLDLDTVQLGWVATAYLLAMAAGLVPAGKIADIYGRKKLYLLGLTVYLAGTVAAVFTSTGAVLILSRAIQGLGCAIFATTGMAMLTAIFPPHKRGRVIGIYVAAVYVGLSVGPFVGGLLTEYFGWRMVFIGTLPLGAGALVLASFLLKGEWRGEGEQFLDIPACLLYVLTILSLVYGSTLLPAHNGVLLVSLGAVLLAVFITVQMRASYPVFEVRLFTENRRFAFSCLAALLHYSASFGVIFLLSLYLQYIKGLSPRDAGTILMAQPVIMAFFSPITGRLADRVEPRYLATAGMLITALGLLFFRTLDRATTTGMITVALVLLGFGFALFSSPNMSTIMGSVKRQYYGVASATVSTMRLLGQMLNMAVVVVVLRYTVGHEAIQVHNFDAFLTALQLLFSISLVFCCFGLVFSWFRGETQT